MRLAAFSVYARFAFAEVSGIEESLADFSVFGATTLIAVVDLISLFFSYYSPGVVQAVLPLAAVAVARSMGTSLCDSFDPRAAITSDRSLPTTSARDKLEVGTSRTGAASRAASRLLRP